MAALKLRIWKGPQLHDIDEPTDLVHVPPPWGFGGNTIGKIAL
jgi:hypothetical protein